MRTHVVGPQQQVLLIEECPQHRETPAVPSGPKQVLEAKYEPMDVALSAPRGGDPFITESSSALGTPADTADVMSAAVLRKTDRWTGRQGLCCPIQ